MCITIQKKNCYVNVVLMSMIIPTLYLLQRVENKCFFRIYDILIVFSRVCVLNMGNFERFRRYFYLLVVYGVCFPRDGYDDMTDIWRLCDRVSMRTASLIEKREKILSLLALGLMRVRATGSPDKLGSG